MSSAYRVRLDLRRALAAINHHWQQRWMRAFFQRPPARRTTGNFPPGQSNELFLGKGCAFSGFGSGSHFAVHRDVGRVASGGFHVVLAGNHIALHLGIR